MNSLPKTMKAAVCENYGGPEQIQIREVALPSIGDGELLVRCKSSAITRADTMLRSGTPKFARPFIGFRKPNNPRIGTGFSGVVIRLGASVQGFAVGDEVFGETAMLFAANAEFLRVPQSGVVVKKAAQISHNVASVLCDGVLTSYNFLSDVYELEQGQTILINGAAGSLGSAAIQIAKNKGCRVIGTSSPENFAFLKSLGAEQVIDYRDETALYRLGSIDCIYDTVGLLRYRKIKKVLSKNGKYLSPVLSIGLLGQVLMAKVFRTKKSAHFEATGLKDSSALKRFLLEISEMVSSGAIKVKIEKQFSIDELTEAHRSIETGHKRANYVITF